MPEQHRKPAIGVANIESGIGRVREALTGLNYGNVTLTVHEGRIVQIDVTARTRF